MYEINNKRIHVLMLNPYFEPEVTADTHLEKDIINGLLEKGADVTVICPIPSRGIDDETRKKYKNRKHEIVANGFEIYRFWAPKENKNVILRAVRYFYTNIRTISVAKKIQNVDAIYCISTPPTQGIVGSKVFKFFKKRNSKVKFIYNVQDLFPESLVNTGLAKQNGFLWKIGYNIAKKSYQDATSLITITNRFKENICNKGIPSNKVTVISNWIDLNNVCYIPKKENHLFKKFNLDVDSFNVVYAGNFGESQGTEILYEVAKTLLDYTDIKFIFFGGGTCFDEQQKRLSTLKNVFVHTLLNVSESSSVYSLGDVDLILCKKGTGNSGMPSKLWSIMACNRPIIASFDEGSDLADSIKASHCGTITPPGDFVSLKETILNYYDKWKNQMTCTYNFREYVKSNAEKSSCVSKYIDVICGSN